MAKVYLQEKITGTQGQVVMINAQGNAEAQDALSSVLGHISDKDNPHNVTAAQTGAVPVGRTVNGKALSADITLAAGDVGADAAGTAAAAVGAHNDAADAHGSLFAGKADADLSNVDNAVFKAKAEASGAAGDPSRITETHPVASGYSVKAGDVVDVNDAGEVVCEKAYAELATEAWPVSDMKYAASTSTTRYPILLSAGENKILLVCITGTSAPYKVYAIPGIVGNGHIQWDTPQYFGTRSKLTTNNIISTAISNSGFAYSIDFGTGSVVRLQNIGADGSTTTLFTASFDWSNSYERGLGCAKLSDTKFLVSQLAYDPSNEWSEYRYRSYDGTNQLKKYSGSVRNIPVPSNMVGMAGEYAFGATSGYCHLVTIADDYTISETKVSVAGAVDAPLYVLDDTHIYQYTGSKYIVYETNGTTASIYAQGTDYDNPLYLEAYQATKINYDKQTYCGGEGYGWGVTALNASSYSVSGNKPGNSYAIALTDATAGQNVEIALEGLFYLEGITKGQEILDVTGYRIGYGYADGKLRVDSKELGRQAYVMGSYTGDNAMGRIIDLGFEPTLVLVQSFLNSGSYAGENVTMVCQKEIPFRFSSVTSKNYIIQISNNGFILGTSGQSASNFANKNTYVYNYIAFR